MALQKNGRIVSKPCTLTSLLRADFLFFPWAFSFVIAVTLAWCMPAMLWGIGERKALLQEGKILSFPMHRHHILIKYMILNNTCWSSWNFTVTGLIYILVCLNNCSRSYVKLTCLVKSGNILVLEVHPLEHKCNRTVMPVLDSTSIWKLLRL